MFYFTFLTKTSRKHLFLDPQFYQSRWKCGYGCFKPISSYDFVGSKHLLLENYSENKSSIGLDTVRLILFLETPESLHEIDLQLAMTLSIFHYFLGVNYSLQVSFISFISFVLSKNILSGQAQSFSSFSQQTDRKNYAAAALGSLFFFFFSFQCLVNLFICLFIYQFSKVLFICYVFSWASPE